MKAIPPRMTRHVCLDATICVVALVRGIPCASFTFRARPSRRGSLPFGLESCPFKYQLICTATSVLGCENLKRGVLALAVHSYKAEGCSL